MTRLPFLRTLVIAWGAASAVQATSWAQSTDSEAHLNFTYINLSPEQLRVSVKPSLAKQERTEPLFESSTILQTPIAEVARKMKSGSNGFPKEWANVPIAGGDDRLIRAIRRKRVRCGTTDVMCLVLQLRTGVVSNLAIEFKRTKIAGAREIFDDDEALALDTGAQRYLDENATWEKQVRTVSGMNIGQSLICPLYLCEWLEGTAANPDSGPWRMARGEVWIPVTLRYDDVSKKQHYEIAIDQVPGRYTRWSPDDRSIEVVRTNLESINTSSQPERPAIRGISEGIAPHCKWLATYFSFNDPVKLAEERKAKKDTDAFLDYPWVRSGVPPPEQTSLPPSVSSILFANNSDKKAYQMEQHQSPLRVMSAEILSLSLRLAGDAVTNATVRVQRIKLSQPVHLFRNDGSLVTEDYVSLLQRSGTTREDFLPIGAIVSGSGINIPLFVVYEISEDGTHRNDSDKKWRIVVNEVIIPISVVQEEGPHIYETPIRRMSAVPWRISEELFGRN